MAQLRYVNARNSRKKKWAFYRLKAKHYLYKISILVNIYLLSVIYHDKLTNIYDRLHPLLDSLTKYLPHLVR